MLKRCMAVQWINRSSRHRRPRSSSTRVPALMRPCSPAAGEGQERPQVRAPFIASCHFRRSVHLAVCVRCSTAVIACLSHSCLECQASQSRWCLLDDCCCGQGMRGWSSGGMHTMCPCGPQTPACPRAGQPSSALCPHQMAPFRDVTADRPMSTPPCPQAPAAVSRPVADC